MGKLSVGQIQPATAQPRVGALTALIGIRHSIPKTFSEKPVMPVPPLKSVTECTFHRHRMIPRASVPESVSKVVPNNVADSWAPTSRHKSAALISVTPEETDGTARGCILRKCPN